MEAMLAPDGMEGGGHHRGTESRCPPCAEVGLMNTLKAQAEEIVLTELICQ